MESSGTLLATCAGSGATLVAIVGGLLVSRYLSLESEASGLRKQIGSLTERLSSAKTALSVATEQLQKFELHRAMASADRVLQLILAHAQAGTSLSAVEVDDWVDLDGYDEKVVTQTIDTFTAEGSRVIQFDWREVPVARSHDRWEDFRERHGIKVAIPELWEWIYLRYCEKRVPKEEPRSFGVSFSAGLDPALLSTVDVEARNKLRDERNRLVSSRDAAQAQMFHLQVELDLAVRARDSRARPPGLIWGLTVLAYLTVVSVVLPILLLAPAPASLTRAQAAWVVALFLSGVLLLFGYMGVYVRRLLRPPAT